MESPDLPFEKESEGMPDFLSRGSIKNLGEDIIIFTIRDGLEQSGWKDFGI